MFDARQPNAIERDEHVIGGEVVAVVKLHALAQIEAPCRRARLLPVGREAGCSDRSYERWSNPSNRFDFMVLVGPSLLV